MSKAILVMDMPKNCSECNQCQCGNEDGEYSCIPDNFAHYLSSNYVNHSCESKPDWCPLKPIPEKVEEYPKEYYEFGNIGLAFDVGYNTCIDKILNS